MELMSRPIAAKSPSTIRDDIYSLKRDALFFQTIYTDVKGMMNEAITEVRRIESCNRVLNINDNSIVNEKKFAISELEWLAEQKILSDFSISDEFNFTLLEKNIAEELLYYYKLYYCIDRVRQLKLGAIFNDIDDENDALLFKKVYELFSNTDVFEVAKILESVEVRFATIAQGVCNNINIYPLLSLPDFLYFLPKSKKTDVVTIAINTLPIPDSSTPWEAILEYRADPDSKGKFLGLKNWINEIAKSGLTPSEIYDKLEWLMYDYKRHIELHKLKSTMGVIETIVTVSAELLENLLKLKLKDASKLLFAFKQSKLSLLEAEIKAPGREIAYLIKCKETFK